METNGWQSPQHFERSFLLQTHLMMDQSRRTTTPSPDKVSSAADAMLKLASTPHIPMYHMNQQRVVYPPPSQQHHQQHHQQQLQQQLQQQQHPSQQAPTPQPPQPPMGQHQVCPPSAPVALVSDPHDLTIVEGEIDSDVSIGHILAGTIPRMSRKQREFTPDYKKDESYWVKRRKNNEAAKRSREKRRYNDIAMGTKILNLSEDNDKLRRELRALKRKFGLPLDVEFYDESMDDDLPSPCPSNQSFSLVSEPEPSQVQTPHVVFKEVKPLERSNSQVSMPILIPISTPNNITVSTSGHYSVSQQNDYGTYSHSDSSLSISPTSMASNPSPSVCGIGNVAVAEQYEDEGRHLYNTDSNENGHEEESKPLERSRERKGIPHKLRHKEQFLEPTSEAEQSPGESSNGSSRGSSSGSNSNHTTSSSTDSLAGLLTTSDDMEPSPQSVEDDVEERMNQPNPEEDMHTSDSHTSGDGQEQGGDASSQRLSDRRKRAAQVQARRNRQKGRKMMNNMQLTKSQLLESENNHLKEELRHLASEVNNLKEWMQQKSAAENIPPPAN